MQEFPVERSLRDAAMDYPRVLHRTDEPDGSRLELEITPDLKAFRGHFPGNPVLAGIVQLHWAVLASRSIFGFSDPPAEIKNLKFKSVIVPPATVELAICRIRPQEVQYECSGSGKKFSLGRLVFPRSAAC